MTIIYRVSWFSCRFLLPAKHFLELLESFVCSFCCLFLLLLLEIYHNCRTQSTGSKQGVSWFDFGVFVHDFESSLRQHLLSFVSSALLQLDYLHHTFLLWFTFGTALVFVSIDSQSIISATQNPTSVLECLKRQEHTCTTPFCFVHLWGSHLWNCTMHIPQVLK